VTSLLNAGANVNTANQHGITPLWIAMQNNDADVAHALLDAKASDPSRKLNLDQPLGPWGNTLLMQAIVFLSEAKASSYVHMLLDRGASVNATNQYRKTALFAAVLFDRKDLISLLLDKGADPNAKDANLNRPLHFAQSVEAVTILVTTGAKINVKNKQGNCPLHIAFAFQNRLMANVLIASGANENTVNGNGETCSVLARYFGSKFAFPFFLGDAAFNSTGGIHLEQ
jgi:ankyrin repeat protein